MCWYAKIWPSCDLQMLSVACCSVVLLIVARSFVFCFARFLARCFDDSRVSGLIAGTVLFWLLLPCDVYMHNWYLNTCTCSFVFCLDRLLARNGCFDDSPVCGQMAGTVAVVFVDLQFVGMQRLVLVVTCRGSVRVACCNVVLLIVAM